MNDDAQLPSYARPPVVEVAASVQFEQLPAAKFVHFGLLWERYRQQFPNVEEKPPLTNVIERLGISTPSPSPFIVAESPGAVRMWFVSESGDELIQIQSDRFVRNWRAVASLGNEYPRYKDCIRPRFLADFEVFQKFLEDEKLGVLEPNQCELTYVNHIRVNECWSAHKEAAKAVTIWLPDYTHVTGLEAESLNLRMSHLLHDQGGEFVGRLHVSLQSGYRTPQSEGEQKEPILLLTLTARGRPLKTNSSAGIAEFFDFSRRVIVRTFDKMTSPCMHKAWGKIHGSSS